MSKKVELIKKVGEKVAGMSIGPLCFPLAYHQPKPPAKIQEQMQKNK